MSHFYLTKCKLSIIELFIKPPKLYHTPLSIIDIPHDMPKFNTSFEIYYFKYDTKNTHLKFIYKYNDVIYNFDASYWYSKFMTLKSLENKFSKMTYNVDFHSAALKAAEKVYIMPEKEEDFYYVKVNIIEDYNIDELQNIPLIERITPDYDLGGFDVNELYKLTGKTTADFIKFDTIYENIDFDDLFDDDDCDHDNINYHYNIKDFNGNKIQFDDYEKDFNCSDVCKKIKAFLYQRYSGCKYGWYGYSDYLFNNYILVLKNGLEYMYVSYCVDNASCAGYHFTLESNVFDSFESLWDRLSDDKKDVIIKANMK